MPKIGYISKRAYTIARQEGLLSLCEKIATKLRRRHISRPASMCHPLATHDGGIFAIRPATAELKPIKVPISQYSPIPEPGKIAVIFHAFYVDLVDEMLRYINNIRRPFDLFVSTDTREKSIEIARTCRMARLDYLKQLDIRIFPNRGRDIAPKYFGFLDVYDSHEIFLHLHTKKSLHSQGLYDGWRNHLLERLLGSPEIAESNISLLQVGKIGVVYPVHAPFLGDAISWGGNFSEIQSLLKTEGIDLHQLAPLEFPSGSMYWGKSNAIRRLLARDLSFNDFPEEAGQVDGTLAHAIERSILFFAEINGFDWVQVGSADDANAHSIVRVDSAAEAQAIVSNRRIALTDPRPLKLTQLGRSVPEIQSIAPVVDECAGPRLNLLVPTVLAAHSYGGIDTAIRIALEVRKHWPGNPCVLRIVSTDSDLNGPLSARLQGMLSGADSIIAVHDRNNSSIGIRKNDVFIATAWWTAILAKQFAGFQGVKFGTAHPFAYLIQDFEPNFYGWSSRYSMAESTYSDAQGMIAVFNSEELCAYFLKRFDMPEYMVIPFEINAAISASILPAPRERQIVFYARPFAARNCFEIGMDAICAWQRRNPDIAAKWSVHLVGECFDPSIVAHVPNTVLRGKLSLEEYGKLISSASVGVSLMVSPHPSYPPLEMAYAGLRVVTNSYECKDLSLRSSRIISLKTLNVASLANALDAATAEMESAIGKVTAFGCPIAGLESSAPKYSGGSLANILARSALGYF